jgi:hypothetical protein
MICSACGADGPTGAKFCPSCGSAFLPPSPPPQPGSLHDLAHEAKRAASDLARASSRVSARLLEKAGSAAKDPPAAVKKGLHRVSQELDATAKELEKLLKDL